MENPFVLERAKKTIDHGVVIAIPFSTHAEPHPMRLKPALIQTAGIRDAQIAVMNRSEQRAVVCHRHPL